MQKEDRRPLYAKVAIARKQLPEMDNDDVFYGYLTQEFGSADKPVTSKKELTFKQLVRLVNQLGRLGAVYTSKGSNKKTTPHARPDWLEIPEGAPHADLKRQICAIWRKLGYSMTSLETRVERQFGAPTLLWVHDRDKLSALLTDLQARERAFEKKKAGGASETDA